MEKIKLITNCKKYQICDENDKELGVIEVDVTDFNFFTRAKEAEKAIENALQELKALTQNNVMSNEEKLVEFSKLDTKVKAQINFMFDYDVSSVVFGNKHCLSFGNGEMFLHRFLKAVVPAIKRDIANEQNKSRQKIQKYTKRYHK